MGTYAYCNLCILLRPVWDVNLSIGLQVLLCLCLIDYSLELLTIDLLLLNQNLCSLVKNADVALYQILCPPTIRERLIYAAFLRLV